jgi:ribosomal protein S18 acetylase RimI-like enzyme
MHYKLVPLTENEIERLRLIRNNCRQFMTNNQQEISRSEQLAWFKSLDPDRHKVFLFKVPHEGVYYPVGYGIVNLDNWSAVLTGGIVTGYRGLGYGRKLFEELVSQGLQYRKRVRLDVLRSNERAISLYKSLGFVMTDGDDIIHMELQ